MDTGRLREQRAEVTGAYQAAVRLRLYARLSGMLGIVAAGGFFGAMIVGGVGVEEGVTGIAMSLLITVSSAATFYDQANRTEITAASVERSLGLDEDLYASVSETREKLVTWTVIAAAVCAVGLAAILTLSFANANTESDDDDDDDKKTEQVDDRDGSGGGESGGDSDGDD
jgi:hypothetical protein